jgi:hypothetical protein
LGGLMLCVVVFLWGILRIAPIQKDLQMTQASRPPVVGLSSEMTVEQIQSIVEEQKNNIGVLKKAFQRDIFMTHFLTSVAAVVPEGVWLTDWVLTYDQKSHVPELSLRGMAYIKDGQQEVVLINTFVDALKKDAQIASSFNTCSVGSITRDSIKGQSVTVFSLSCKNQ